MKFFKFLFVSCLFLNLYYESAIAQYNASADLDSLLKNIQSYQRKQDPFSTYPEAVIPQTWENFQNQQKQFQQFLDKVQAIPDKTLSRQEQITKSLIIMSLKDHISEIHYKIVLIPFNAEGGFYNNVGYRLSSMSFKTKEDYQKYIKWLPHYADYIKQNQALMQKGIKEGVVASKVIVQNTLELIKPWLNTDFAKNSLTAPFQRIPESISSFEKEEIKNKAKSVMEKKVFPAYNELVNFMKNDYLKAAKEEVGISAIPQGKVYYEDRVRHYTTLNISPDSVFNLGLQEVKRIRSSMDSIIRSLDFKGSFADFLDFLRTDPQFYPETGEALLQKAAWLSKKSEGQLPKLFSNLYKLPFTVEPVPDNIAPYYTGGRYVPGSRESNRAGIYWVNTYQLKSRTLYTLPSLTLHEAVPGHHLQIMRATELEGIPDFRKHYYISAFGEGWGLYAEYLGEEMGMYSTPYEQFGRYTYEMWRACRLVVDVGMHYKGWSRSKALDYMAENTALSLHEVTTEIDRYIGWPGQALSYKMGEIKIKSLRQKAQAALKDKFDIQLFHETILKNGSVPLSVLDEEVEMMIKSIK